MTRKYYSFSNLMTLRLRLGQRNDGAGCFFGQSLVTTMFIKKPDYPVVISSFRLVQIFITFVGKSKHDVVADEYTS